MSNPDFEAASRYQRLGLPVRDGEFSFLKWDEPATPKKTSLHFSHANGFNAATYAPLLCQLADRFAITAHDLRGHGRTDLPADPGAMTSWLVYRDDLVEFLGHGLQDRGPIILAGHSMGGSSSILATAKCPELTKGIILIDPVVLPEKISDYPAGPNVLAEQAAKRSAVWPSRDFMVSKYRGRGMFENWQDGFLEAYVEGGTCELKDGTVRLSCAPEWESANFSAHAPEIWEAAEKVDVPVLLIRGDVGSSCPADRARALAKRLGNTEIVFAEGTSHFVPMERPDFVIETILDWTGRHFG